MNYLRERRINKMAKKLEDAGLRGQVVGETSLSSGITFISWQG